MSSRDTNLSLWFAAPGRVEVRSDAVPVPESNEVLIRARRTLISTGTELSLFKESAQQGLAWREFAQFPRQVGYSHVGEVVDVGEGVHRGWIGRRVASRGRHALWTISSVDDLRPIPDAVCDDDATFTTLAGVAMHGLRRIGLTWGDSVAVYGLGIIGQLSVRIATAVGAGPVFGIEISQLRLGKLPQHSTVYPLAGGVDCALNDEIRARNAGRLVDIVVEATAEPEMIPLEIEVLRDEGRMLLLSSPHGPTLFDFHDLCNRRSISIVGAHGFSQPRVETPASRWTSKRSGDLFLRWLAEGRVSVGELITHRFPFDRASEAYALLSEQRSQALGVIIEWT